MSRNKPLVLFRVINRLRLWSFETMLNNPIDNNFIRYLTDEFKFETVSNDFKIGMFNTLNPLRFKDNFN
jgi:hypothetical protein